jgi:hypothetical protein
MLINILEVVGHVYVSRIGYRVVLVKVNRV